MAMFNGASVGKVEFDFTDFGIDERGIIPEPSRHLMAEVLEEVQDIFRRVRDEEIDSEDIDDVRDALDRLGEDHARGMDVGEMTDALLVPVGKLCGNVPRYETQPDPENEGETIQVLVGWDQSGGRPTYDAIEKLGFRIFLAFMSYAMEQMTSPEASSGESPQNSTTPTRRETRQIRRLTKR